MYIPVGQTIYTFTIPAYMKDIATSHLVHSLVYENDNKPEVVIFGTCTLLFPICTNFKVFYYIIEVIQLLFPKNKATHLVSNAALNLNNGKHIPGISCSIGMINILSLSALESLLGSTVTCSNREPI